jgi:hypothetical protein
MPFFNLLLLNDIICGVNQCETKSRDHDKDQECKALNFEVFLVDLVRSFLVPDEVCPISPSIHLAFIRGFSIEWKQDKRRVIPDLFEWIGEDVVGFVYIFEDLFSLGETGIPVGMILESKTFIGSPNFR